MGRWAEWVETGKVVHLKNAPKQFLAFQYLGNTHTNKKWLKSCLLISSVEFFPPPPLCSIRHRPASVSFFVSNHLPVLFSKNVSNARHQFILDRKRKNKKRNTCHTWYHFYYTPSDLKWNVRNFWWLQMILITSVFPFILCVGGWLGFPFSEQVIPAPFSLSFLILFIFYFLNFNIILAHAILPGPNEKESESKVVVFVFHRRPAKTDWAGGCYLLHFWVFVFRFCVSFVTLFLFCCSPPMGKVL